jgi:hypothetical protein
MSIAIRGVKPDADIQLRPQFSQNCWSQCCNSLLHNLYLLAGIGGCHARHIRIVQPLSQGKCAVKPGDDNWRIRGQRKHQSQRLGAVRAGRGEARRGGAKLPSWLPSIHPNAMTSWGNKAWRTSGRVR